MDIPSAFTNSLPLPIRTKTPDPFPDFHASPPRTPQFSSLDSGYGSAEPTPVKEPSDVGEVFDFCGSYTLDGSTADSAEYQPKVDVDGCPRSALLSPHQKFLGLAADSIKQGGIKPYATINGASLRHPHRSRLGLPSAFYTKPSQRSDLRRGSDSLSSYLSSSTSSLVTSIRAPDRFVHPRDSDCAAFALGEKFRLVKPATDLTDIEKILRHDQVSPDAFVASTTHHNPVPTFANNRQEMFERNGRPTQTRSRTTLLPGQLDNDPDSEFDQGLMHGSVWSIGTVPPIVGAVDNGRGTLTQTGTAAPFFSSDFVPDPFHRHPDADKHCGRLAAALDFDQASRLLQCNVDKGVFKLQSDHTFAAHQPNRKPQPKTKKTAWNGVGWEKEGAVVVHPTKRKTENTFEMRPYRVLSAPKFRDDFYCSLLAYSPTCDTIAVGLADLLYTWSEAEGAAHINGSDDYKVWLTSMAFSSEEGGRSILAFGRSNNVFGLMAMDEANNARMLVEESSSISCLSWRPTCTMRPSKNPNNPGVLVGTEDLLVGTDSGMVLYYIVEWPDKEQMEKDKWQGDITLAARLTAHDQQVCGLAWSPDGLSFATGGNDNYCCFFYTNDVLPLHFRPGGTGRVSEGAPRRTLHSDSANSRLTVKLSNGSEVRERVRNDRFVRRLERGMETWRWEHGAAVKAVAFCPWQDGLVATGGGSNDRCIHFYHTSSGTALATIFVSSQVTSLIWSTTRREIAVTFGFAHPSHPVRIAMYSWPECKQVATIPWEGKHRALYGISCSRSLRSKLAAKKEGKDTTDHKALKDGCIAVASSEESIKFYELWPSDGKPIMGGVGMLGGSDILEDMEGIQKEGDIIR
ncbi:hypothetical protein SEUCBS140593_002331 [Sporothrix eucalyptigena]|uniref:Uncharacterized protein n=1 Tax=Sporothrix eucalyptigena TaxID=1812306 RepID=A0ABP0B5M1_9PEZI